MSQDECKLEPYIYADEKLHAVAGYMDLMARLPGGALVDEIGCGDR